MKLSRRKIGTAIFWAVTLVGGLLLFTSHPSPLTLHRVSEKETYYCPMHPGYTSDKPGDCPICNMKLVKRVSTSMGQESHPGEHGQPGGPAEHAAVQIPLEKQQLIGVKTEPARKRLLTRTIRTVGQIAYDPDLYQAQAEYLQAVKASRRSEGSAGSEASDQAKRVVEAARTRLKLLGLGDASLQTMEAWDGPDQSLILASPQGRVWLYARIYEFDLPLVRPGQKIQVEIPAIPGKRLEGTLEAIDLVLDPMTRSARARAVLTDPEGILRPQMYVNASLSLELGERLAVPAEAVLDSGTRQILFVDRGKGFLEPREVEPGVRVDGYVEILKGVSEGEPVVVSGGFLIDSESRLKAALEGMSGPEHPHGS